MLKFSKKVDYAIILLSHLGQHSEPVSAQEIASHYQLPNSMIANILKELATEGIIESTRGQSGGYCLGRDPDKVSLADIIEIFDGNFALVECAHQDDSCCKIEHCCPTRSPLLALHKQVQSLMESVNLASIIASQKTPHVLERRSK